MTSTQSTSTQSAQSGVGISPVAVIEFNGEPRVLDEMLAKALGFSRTRKIRGLIDRHMDELSSFGAPRWRTKQVRSGRGRISEVREYLLTEQQALLISCFSDAPHAAAVRRSLIEVFVAWRHSHAAPTRIEPPKPAKPKNVSRIRFWKFRFAEAAANLDALGVNVESIGLSVVTAFGRVIGASGDCKSVSNSRR
jgi:hypothetical protein